MIYTKKSTQVKAFQFNGYNFGEILTFIKENGDNVGYIKYEGYEFLLKINSTFNLCLYTTHWVVKDIDNKYYQYDNENFQLFFS